ALVTPITVVTAEDIERRGITRIDQLFRGDVPGVVALEQGSAVFDDSPGAMMTSRVYARGASSLDASVQTPLKTFVDGVELMDPSYLGTIDPSNIERIEIITGPQAATVYGSGAMGGVMQIFTKKGQQGMGLDVVFTAKYGVLENNISRGKTPTHH